MNNNVQPIPTLRIYVNCGVVQGVEIVDSSFDFMLDVEIVDDDLNEERGLPDGEITATVSLNQG